MRLLHDAMRVPANLMRRVLGRNAADSERANLERACHFDQLETRRLMAIDVPSIHLGSVYLETDDGNDARPDEIRVTFNGGAPGTQLTRLELDGDKNQDGRLSPADIYFDTADGGAGVFDNGALVIDPSPDFTVVSATVDDGSTKIIFELSGFEAGETLVFHIDVDERGSDDSGEFDTALAEGGEFAGSYLRATFTAPQFETAQAETRFADGYDKTFSKVAEITGITLDLPKDNWPTPEDSDRHDRTAGAAVPLTQVLPPVTLSGYVYHDRDNDGLREAGEEGIRSVPIRVELVTPLIVGEGFPAAGETWEATTDSKGFWSVADLVPGEYKVVEVSQPNGYIDGLDREGNHGGTAINPGDRIEDVNLQAGDDGVEYNFGEILPASITGRVHADLDGDCVFDPGEAPIAGVAIELRDDDGKVVDTTQTNAQGFYEFADLPPGTYTVHEVQPGDFLDGGETVGTAGGRVVGDDTIGEIVLASGVHGTNYNFCEHPPASISGRVWVDANDNDQFDAGESAIANVLITLVAQDGEARTTTTDANGLYEFDRLEPGVYTIRETQPAGYIDSGERAGNLGGNDAANDVISAITVGYGNAGVNYDFWELLPASIMGCVFVDSDGDGVHDEGERLLEGVVIELLDGDNNVIDTTETGEDGKYKFDDLVPGKYGIRERQPPGYIDGGEVAGSEGGSVSDDLITQIMLMSGRDGVDYNFWEYEPSRIAGRVLEDLDGDCVHDPDTERGLPGVTIELWKGDAKFASTITDANGHYEFNGLPPGVYTVHEIQPVTHFDGGDHVGTAGGVVSANDTISQIVLTGGTVGLNYDFCEFLPSRIAGLVFHDVNDNGRFDDSDPIGGVTVELINDATGNVVGTTATNSDGEFAFEHLAPGSYSLRETQPVGYLDSGERAGPVGGAATNDLISGIVLVSGTNAAENEFWELLPASISGIVHEDLDDDCVVDPGEPGIEGVTIELLDQDNNLLATTLTDADGRFRFDNLRPGVYTLHEVQPNGYFHAGERVGSAGGIELAPDLIGQIELGSGVHAVDYIFCEEPPVTLSGYVFQDGPIYSTVTGGLPPVDDVYNGLRTADDTPIAGVTIRLLDANGDPAGTAVTNSDGFYRLDGLRAGTYTLVEVQPEGYEDWLDTAGNLGGVAENDLIREISVPVNLDGVEYNFSEVRVGTLTIFQPPVPTPLPPPATIPAPLFRPLPFAPPFVPQPIIRSPFYGSDGQVPYSWHLSVVNAGLPRSVEFRAARLSAATTSFATVAWRNARRLEDVNAELNGEAGNRQTFTMRNAIPITGDFNGDGTSEFGMYIDGDWYIDVNANGVWDEGDMFARLGSSTDKPVVGDWDGDGKTDIGIFGPMWPGDPPAVKAEPGVPDAQNEEHAKPKNLPPRPVEATDRDRVMQLTSQGTVRRDVIDHVFFFGQVEDIPVVGDINGDGIDSIGVFHGGTWHLDRNGDGRFDAKDRVFEFGQPGDVPFIGDFDGNGIDEVAIYRQGNWIVDSNRNFSLDENDTRYRIGGAPSDVPIVADWNGDGVDEPGIYQPGS